MRFRNVIAALIVILLIASLSGILPSSEVVGFFGFGGIEFDSSGPPEMNEEESCVNDCVSKYCDSLNKEAGSADDTPEQIQANMAKYAECMQEHQKECDKKCGMSTEPDVDDMDEEQKCISDCVATHDPDTICGSSKEGETGGDVCQMCAQQCVHLYEGPCLNDEQITEKENDCAANCAHCYGSPVEGPSGQGWDCIVDISCEDASAEFGDDPGSGPGIGQEGYVNPEESSGFAEAISDFFSNLF